MNFWHFKKPIHIISETELTKLTLQRPIFSHIVTFANGDGIVVVETDDEVVIVVEVVAIVDEVVVLLDVVGIVVEFVEGVVGIDGVLEVVVLLTSYKPIPIPIPMAIPVNAAIMAMAIMYFLTKMMTWFLHRN